LLANRLGFPSVGFTAPGDGVAGLVNGIAEVTNQLVALSELTNQLVTVAIWFTGLAMRLAWLAI